MPRPGTFEEFFEVERDRLFRVLCLITGSRHEAEEIAQDAFVAMWERWDRLDAVDDLPGYLHRTAINAFRKRYRRSRVALRHAVGAAPVLDVFEAVDARLVVGRALQDLTPRQRAAVVLTELLGYTAEAAGKELGIRASTVRALSFQARSALRSGGRLSDV
jgi:RNA polymerase sigma-70 factor (ECF subfamily)